MNRFALILCLLLTAFTAQAQTEPPSSQPASLEATNPPLQLSLTADQLRRLLLVDCSSPTPTIEPQGFLLDLTRRAATRAFEDEARTARWVTGLLLEATDRHLITLDPDLAERLGLWLAHGLALTTRDDLTVDELVQWIAEGAELTSQAVTREGGA